MKAIQDKIVSMLVGKIGMLAARAIMGIVAWMIMAAINWAQYHLSTFSPMLAKMAVEQLNGVDQGKIVVEIWLALNVALSWVSTHYLTKWVKPIQTALVRAGYDLKIDGWAGDATVGALIKETGLPVMPAIPVEPSKP